MKGRSTIIPVILSGGSGTRLWPVSRPAVPKQFLPLTAVDTMFQLTLKRVAGRPEFASPIIVASVRHQSLVEEQLEEKGWSGQAIILEPCARNTAPAIALAAHAVDPESLLLIMPSDHAIADEEAFRAAVAAAAPWAEKGWMMTFGITPTGPETGYGYIEMGEGLDGTVRQVVRFVEKPDRATAKSYLAQGHFTWNGGIFLIRADRYLAAIKQFVPAMHDAVAQAWEGRTVEVGVVRPEPDAFASSPSDSIDYAVMERADRVGVVPVSMGWSDVGSWDALHEIGARDAAGNVAAANARLVDANGNLVWSDGPEVSLLGVDDLIVVVGDGKVMVTRRGASQRVKELSN